MSCVQRVAIYNPLPLGWALRGDVSLLLDKKRRKPVTARFVTGTCSQDALPAPAPSSSPRDRSSAVVYEFTSVCRLYDEESKHINELR